MRNRAAILASFLLFNCTAVQQQKSLPPASDDLHFRNLQVLPQNISRDELLTVMRRFTQALGVSCDYCHTQRGVRPDGSPDLDFPSDGKREKSSAREMMRMTREINTRYVSKIPDAHTVVTCWTCHRGEAQPDVVPSLPAEQRASLQSIR